MNELTPDEHGILVDAIHDSATIVHKGRMMNERITELMLEAGKTIPGDKHIDADFCEKFAELIVRECMAVAVNKDSGYIHPADVAGYMAAGRSTAAQMIKQHFGVEE